MVNVVAHRGFSGKYPENTQIAFEKALALNVEMIELDLHLSRDRHLIVIHDPTVDRTSDGTGKVEELTLAEIKSLNAGSWFAPEFHDQKFLTFQEALDIMANKVRLNIHIKAYDHDREIIVPLVVEEVKKRELFDSAFVASDQDSLVLAKKIEPRLVICNLSTEPTETYIDRSREIGCQLLQPGNRQVDYVFMERAHQFGLEVNPFYADDEAEMQRLIDCGVDGILTNYPDLLLSIRDNLN